jgi:vancomycin resistance protein VanJ
MNRSPADPMVAVAVLVVTFLLTAHRLVPDGPGTLLESGLPWLGLLVVAVAVGALVRAAWLGLALTLIPAVVWASMFGPQLLDSPPGGAHDLRVVTQNMYAGNTEPSATVARLVAKRPDLVAVEERVGTASTALDKAYPYRTRFGTVGLWSRWPLHGAHEIDLGLGWPRALTTQVTTPHGALTVYVAHLSSARPGRTQSRDATLHHLADAVRADGSQRLLVLGDLNTSTYDRAMSSLIPPLHEAQNTAGRGFGFTWPAATALTRPDHILYRGLKARDAYAVHTVGSDHRAALADFRF